MSPVSGVGPGLSIAGALASTLDGPLLVNGFVLAQGGQVRLCAVLLESYPPPPPPPPPNAASRHSKFRASLSTASRG